MPETYDPLREVIRLCGELEPIIEALRENKKGLISIFDERHDARHLQLVRGYLESRKTLRRKAAVIFEQLNAAESALMDEVGGDPIDLNTKRFLNTFRNHCEIADGHWEHFTFEETLLPRDSFEVEMLFGRVLTERQREAMEIFFGLFGAERLDSISAVGRRLGISSSATDQRIKGAWRLLINEMDGTRRQRAH
jgi:hypothetical protein